MQQTLQNTKCTTTSGMACANWWRKYAWQSNWLAVKSWQKRTQKGGARTPQNVLLWCLHFVCPHAWWRRVAHKPQNDGSRHYYRSPRNDLWLHLFPGCSVNRIIPASERRREEEVLPQRKNGQREWNFLQQKRNNGAWLKKHGPDPSLNHPTRTHWSFAKQVPVWQWHNTTQKLQK